MTPAMARWAGPFVIVMLVLLGPAGAGATDAVAMLSALRATGGEVKVKPVGGAGRPATLFMELHQGDVLEASGQAQAEILYLRRAPGQPATVSVSAAAPVTVSASARGGVTPTATTLVSEVATMFFKLKKKSGSEHVPLGGRGSTTAAAEPVILGPRATRVLAAPLAFIWAGPDVPYTVTVLAPDGAALWTGSHPGPGSLAYPDARERLTPGARYTWRLETNGRYPEEQASFDVVPAAEAQRVAGELAELERVGGYPEGALTLLRAGVLINHELFEAARSELTAAVARRPGDGALRYLLGEVYDRTGLSDQAAQAFAEARAAGVTP
jgi:hypothetical protein